MALAVPAMALTGVAIWLAGRHGQGPGPRPPCSARDPDASRYHRRHLGRLPPPGHGAGVPTVAHDEPCHRHAAVALPASATVIAPTSAPTCADADAWATALTVLGPDRGADRARRLGLDALFLMRDEGGGLRRHLEVRHLKV